MIYGLYSDRDDATTEAVFKLKHISSANYVSINDLLSLSKQLTENDTVYVMSVDRFTSISEVFLFGKVCHERGVTLHFQAESYLDIGKSKKWRPSIIKLISWIETRGNYAKAEMRHYFTMTNQQWRYVDSCFERMNLAILSAIFSSDNGILVRGK